MQDLWDDGQSLDLEPMVDQIATCAHQNRPLHEALCAWLDEPAMAAELVAPPGDPTNADGLRFALHQVLIHERFAQAARRSRIFRTFLATHYASMRDEVEAAIVRLARERGESDDMIKFKLEKWNSILTPEAELTFMDIEGGMPSRSAQVTQRLLTLNILEATDVDRSMGVYENADIGIALAASAATSVPYVDSDQSLIFSYTKEWFDACALQVEHI